MSYALPPETKQLHLYRNMGHTGDPSAHGGKAD